MQMMFGQRQDSVTTQIIGDEVAVGDIHWTCIYIPFRNTILGLSVGRLSDDWYHLITICDYGVWDCVGFGRKERWCGV